MESLLRVVNWRDEGQEHITVLLLCTCHLFYLYLIECVLCVYFRDSRLVIAQFYVVQLFYNLQMLLWCNLFAVSVLFTWHRLCKRSCATILKSIVREILLFSKAAVSHECVVLRCASVAAWCVYDYTRAHYVGVSVRDACGACCWSDYQSRHGWLQHSQRPHCLHQPTWGASWLIWVLTQLRSVLRVFATFRNALLAFLKWLLVCLLEKRKTNCAWCMYCSMKWTSAAKSSHSWLTSARTSVACRPTLRHHLATTPQLLPRLVTARNTTPSPRCWWKHWPTHLPPARSHIVVTWLSRRRQVPWTLATQQVASTRERRRQSTPWSTSWSSSPTENVSIYSSTQAHQSSCATTFKYLSTNFCTYLRTCTCRIKLTTSIIYT